MLYRVERVCSLQYTATHYVTSILILSFHTRVYDSPQNYVLLPGFPIKVMYITNKLTNSVALVRERTTPTERPALSVPYYIECKTHILRTPPPHPVQKLKYVVNSILFRRIHIEKLDAS
jgi:hypothetical protein